MANKPVLHRRDHEHGGSDPVRIVWESTGTSGAGGGGVQFDTYPQAGDWLYVETTDATVGGGTPSDWGIELNSQDSEGIWLHADNANVAIGAGHYLSLAAGNVATISGNQGVDINGSPFTVDVDSGNQLEMSPAVNGTKFMIPASGGVFQIVNSSGTVLFHIP